MMEISMLMMYLGVRDLTDQASLCEVMQGMSDMAEIALAYASDYAKQQMQNDYGLPYYPDGSEMNIWIIGMGKLGACELNVSSDIDLIFSFSQEGKTQGQEHITNQEYFNKVIQLFMQVMQTITAEGFVFRVDVETCLLEPIHTYSNFDLIEI
jgi:glutamate-ammonia-ligase adenylyltransferase